VPRPRDARPRPRGALWLFLLCLLVYNANLRSIGSGDTLPARYLPLAIWRYGTLELDPIARLVAHGHPSWQAWSEAEAAGREATGALFAPWTYWMFRSQQGRLASLYPVVAPILVTPLYLPAAAWLHTRGWEPWRVEWVAAVMEKLSASLLAALAVVVVYRLLRRDAGRWSLPLALAFAFGTNTWMISSQALWQHGAGELLVALALLLATAAPTAARYAALGAVGVAMAANRPPDALIAGAIALAVVWRARHSFPFASWRAAAWLAAGALVPLALVIAYNRAVIGNLSGGYTAVLAPAGFLTHSPWSGFAGLLISPARGLLVFTPFLLFAPLGLSRRLRKPADRTLAALLAAAVVAQLILYAFADWRAGASWGPRWLTDVLPILIWMLAPAPLFLRAPARAALVVTMAASLAVQAIGAFWYAGWSDRLIFAGDGGGMANAWRLANTPFLIEPRHPPQRGDLACSVRGYLDRVGSAPAAAPGTRPPLLVPHARLQGWGLTCGRTPADVLVLADGHVVGETRRFAPPRPDVAAATGTAAPSAWSVAADARGLSPGEHVLQVALRVEPLSDIRIVSESRVRVGADLAPLARLAAARLREHQSAAGYWLTTFTAQPRFEKPGQEMNTFLTAMLIDLLAPVAREHGLEDVLEKARRHLAAQIEPDGLVRYHGLPDGPGMGTLGCPITPDADDTALAWRIVRPPAADPRRGSMLRLLKSYRDARGFYRTWLAPRERYQCLDPGRDPDPADATIQMHVLLMLAEVDLPEAQRLCQTLARSMADDSLWVYYARAPLVPSLRTADLQHIGCVVEIPSARLAPVEGQERWMDVARRFDDAQTNPQDRPQDFEATMALLTALARDDFAELRRTPPLLYHNDLTATVSRYYWSEDFGYALWLRLYDATFGGAGPTGAPR
jgi:hypothetical protein